MTKIGCKRTEPHISITHKKAHELERAKRIARQPKIILVTKSPLKPVSAKQAKRLAELNKIVTTLRTYCNDASELDTPHFRLMRNGHYTEPHHIMGRIGKHLLNPFEIIMLSPDQHDNIATSYERKQELLALIRPIRLAQNFREEDYE